MSTAVRTFAGLVFVAFLGSASAGVKYQFDGTKTGYFLKGDTIVVATDTVYSMSKSSYNWYVHAADDNDDYRYLSDIYEKQVNSCNERYAALHDDFKTVAAASKAYSDNVKVGVDSVRILQDSLRHDIVQARTEIDAAKKSIVTAGFLAKWAPALGATAGVILGVIVGWELPR